METKVWQERQWTVFSVALTGGRGILDLRLETNLLKSLEKKARIGKLTHAFATRIERVLARIDRSKQY